MTEWMEAAKDSSLMRNTMKECGKLWTEGHKQNLCWCYLDEAVDLCENALSYNFGARSALSDNLSTSGHGILENDVLKDDGTNVAAARYRRCLAMLISVTRMIGSILNIAYLTHYVLSEINHKNTYEQFNCVKCSAKKKDDIAYTEDLSRAAAFFCSDLLEIETNDEWQMKVGHEQSDDEETNDEYYKDSGRTGCFEKFKNTFQIMHAFPSPELGMVGWQNALLCKQKRERTNKPVFRPSQQQQQKAIALALCEMAPNDEYGSYTSEGMYNDLNDGRYEKTIYVKTWTGRTITVVISPEKDTRFMKKENERKTRNPVDHQCLVAEGRVLMDNAKFKESGLSDRRTIELTAKLLGRMKHKSLSPKPMDTERDKKRKESEPCIDVSSLDDGTFMDNQEEDPTETRKWMKEAMKDL